MSQISEDLEDAAAAAAHEIERLQTKLDKIDAWARRHIEDPGRMNDKPTVLAARAVRAILRGAS